MNVQSIALGFSVLYGTGVVREDLDRMKISNRSIAWGLAYVLAGLVALAGAGLMKPAVGVFLAQFLEHAALATAAAVALWMLHVWPAGDAKLFIVFALMAVLVDPSRRGFPDYLFLTLLVNIFVPAGLFVVAVVSMEWLAWLSNADAASVAADLKSRLSRLRVRARDEWRHRWNYARCVWNLFALFFAFQWLRARLQPLARGTLGQLALYLALVLGWGPASRVLVRRTTAALALSVVAAVLLPLAAATGWAALDPISSSLRMLATFGLIFTAGRAMLVGYLEAARVRWIAPSELLPGMILTPSSRARFTVRAAAPHSYPDGLSKAEADELRRRLERRRNRPSLSVYRTRSFAVWIAIGYVWTLFVPLNAAQWLLGVAGLRR